MSKNIIHITHKAFDKLRNMDLTLKLIVQSGGCHGVVWDLIQAKHNHKYDERISLGNNKHFIIDHLSVMHVVGCTLDYSETLKASTFVLKSPLQGGQCGCGKSLSM